MPAERLIYECPECDATVLIESWDPQEVGRVYCDCTARMDYVGLESP